jgi:hypothetical protein
VFGNVSLGLYESGIVIDIDPLVGTVNVCNQPVPGILITPDDPLSDVI